MRGERKKGEGGSKREERKKGEGGKESRGWGRRKNICIIV